MKIEKMHHKRKKGEERRGEREGERDERIRKKGRERDTPAGTPESSHSPLEMTATRPVGGELNLTVPHVPHVIVRV